MGVNDLFGGGDFLEFAFVGRPAHPLRLGDVAAQPQPGPFSAPPGMYLFMFLLVFLPLSSVFLWALFSFIR
jgi:hypothetical protein